MTCVQTRDGAVRVNSRNADDHFERVVAAAELAGRLQSTVVAPRSQTNNDRPAPGVGHSSAKMHQSAPGRRSPFEP